MVGGEGSSKRFLCARSWNGGLGACFRTREYHVQEIGWGSDFSLERAGCTNTEQAQTTQQMLKEEEADSASVESQGNSQRVPVNVPGSK